MIQHSICLLTLAGAVAACPADDDRWSRYCRDHAASLSIDVSAPSAEALQLLPDPILKYSNPVRESDMRGEVFLWVQSGRPALVAGIWTVLLRDGRTGRRLSHEWHSLIDESLSIENPHTPHWESGEPGVVWRDVPESPAPSRSPALRLVQMRQIAGRFDAEIDSEGESELRMLRQPIYRYSESVPGVVDGSLFAFCMGTDPEALLWIEATDDESAANKYRFALVHLARIPVHIRFDDGLVETLPLSQQRLPFGRHHLWFGLQEFLEEPAS